MADPHPLTATECEIARAERLLKVAQACILLNVSDRQMRRYRRTGKIHERRMINGAIRIPLSEVQRFRREENHAD